MVWAVEIRAVVNVTTRQRSGKQKRKMGAISLCLKEKLAKMGIEILRRMRRVMLCKWRADQEVDG